MDCDRENPSPFSMCPMVTHMAIASTMRTHRGLDGVSHSHVILEPIEWAGRIYHSPCSVYFKISLHVFWMNVNIYLYIHISIYIYIYTYLHLYTLIINIYLDLCPSLYISIFSHVSEVVFIAHQGMMPSPKLLKNMVCTIIMIKPSWKTWPWRKTCCFYVEWIYVFVWFISNAKRCWCFSHKTHFARRFGTPVYQKKS